MTTEKEFLRRSNNRDLAKAVLSQLNLDFEGIIDRPYDFRNASKGISEFIYYSETTKFAKDNLWLITQALNDFETEIGQPLQ
jgi:hypothetical protein